MIAPRDLLVSIARSGVSQDRLVAMLDNAFLAVNLHGTEVEQDEVVDALDMATGWCHPDWYLPYRDETITPQPKGDTPHAQAGI